MFLPCYQPEDAQEETAIQSGWMQDKINFSMILFEERGRKGTTEDHSHGKKLIAVLQEPMV